MSYPFSKTVNILGNTYKIEFKTPDEDRHLKGHGIVYGYTDQARRKIVLLDRAKMIKEFEPDEFGAILVWVSKTLRHEIVHAFFNESGLQNNTKYNGNWSRNEEMVDWFAIQGPKIHKAWEEAGALILKNDDNITKSTTKKGAVKKTVTRKTKTKEIDRSLYEHA